MGRMGPGHFEVACRTQIHIAYRTILCWSIAFQRMFARGIVAIGF